MVAAFWGSVRAGTFAPGTLIGERTALTPCLCPPHRPVWPLAVCVVVAPRLDGLTARTAFGALNQSGRLLRNRLRLRVRGVIALRMRLFHATSAVCRDSSPQVSQPRRSRRANS